MSDKKFDEWFVLLKNGKEFQFLTSDQHFTNNPLEQIKSYSKGSYWSIPIKSDKYKVDPDNKRNVLIPKSDVQQVYSK